MRTEQVRQRAEGSGSGAAASAALQARACNRHVAEGRAEQERSPLLAPEPAGTVATAAVVLHEGGGLCCDDPLLKPSEKILGFVERKPDPLKRVVRLVEFQHLLVNDIDFPGIDLQPDLDLHVLPLATVFQNAQRGKPKRRQPLHDSGFRRRIGINRKPVCFP